MSKGVLGWRRLRFGCKSYVGVASCLLEVVVVFCSVVVLSIVLLGMSWFLRCRLSRGMCVEVVVVSSTSMLSIACRSLLTS